MAGRGDGGLVQSWAPLSSSEGRSLTKVTCALRVTTRDGVRRPTQPMPEKIVETPYPLIDSDPHASRVVRYFRPSDYAAWAGATAAFPSALYFWGTPTLSALFLS